MGLVAVQSVDFVEVAKLPVNAHLGVAAFAQLLEQVPVVAFAAAYQRGQQVTFASLEVGQDEVDDLPVGIAYHGLSAFGRVGCRGFGEEQAEEVEDFGDGSHRGTRVVARGFLLDGDDGTQSRDAFHLGLLQDAHEVLGIGAERVHISPLTLCIQGVEGQGGLSAAAQARHHHELPAGDIHIHPLQVMRLRSPYFYI